MLEKEFINYLNNGQFYKANQIIQSISFNDLYNMLLKISFENGSLQPYAFLIFSMLHHESALLNHAASVIMSTALSHYEGAFSVGLFHARRAAILEPDTLSHQEWLLSFYGIPNQVMDANEAKNIASHILLNDASNAIALKTMQQISCNF